MPVPKGYEMTSSFWQDMHDHGFLVVDSPTRKVAAYANRDGEVVLAIKDGESCITTLLPSEIGPLVSALLEAEHDARPQEALIEAQYGAYLAIERAKSK
jgi:hypothetical protein